MVRRTIYQRSHEKIGDCEQSNLAESDIQNNFKNGTKYKIKSTTSTRSHAFKNKHRNDN